MKKFLALAVAMLMVLAMSTAVFAQNVTTGSITIENPKAEEQYAAYRIFDLEYIPAVEAVADDPATTDVDESAPAVPAHYVYTINASSPWFAAVQSYPGVTLVASTDHAGTYNVIANTAVEDDPDTAEDETVVGYSAAAFAAHLKTAYEAMDPKPATDAGATVAVEGQDIVWNNLPLGYYFVTSSAGVVCALTSTDYNVVIHDKNEQPPFEKTVNDQSVEVGQNLTFTITGQVPSTTGYTTYTWRVTDTMSTGLDFVEGSVVITVNGETYTPTGSELVETENGFVLNLEMVGRDWNYGDAIVITYHAVVTEAAVVIDEATNTATLRYSNNPDDSSDYEEETVVVKVYTADVIINKTNSTGDKLEGAQFVLYKMVNGVKYYYTYNETTDTVGWTTVFEDATVKTTNAQGAASFIGLEEGDYFLEEIEAPYGYNLLTEAVPVHINANATTHQDTPANVVNYTGSELPETGGIGTTIFYVVGGLMMAAAVVLLATRKKMSVED